MKQSPLRSTTRRQFLGALGATGLTLSLNPLPTAMAAEKRRVPIGLELYSLRNECKDNLAGMLEAVAKIGYKGVEFAGYHGHSAKDLRAMLDKNGLVTCGTHTPYEAVLGDKLNETIEFNQTIGNKFVIVPSMNAKSKAEWIEKGKLFNELADKLRAHGMFIGYHSHAHDFHMVDGESTWDIFAQHTKPQVILLLDTGNCADGGAEPLAVLKKHPGRTKSIHIKPHGSGQDSVIGEDKLPWKDIFAFCDAPGGTQWYVIEHESSKDPLDAVKRSFEALKQFGKV